MAIPNYHTLTGLTIHTNALLEKNGTPHGTAYLERAIAYPALETLGSNAN